MWRIILVGTLVLVLAPAVARETVCDRHTEGGRVLQMCRFVDTPATSPAARKDGDASEAPAPPATAQAPPTATGASASSAPSATHAAAAILCATAAAAPTATVSDAASLLSAKRILRTAGRRARLSRTPDGESGFLGPMSAAR